MEKVRFIDAWNLTEPRMKIIRYLVYASLLAATQIVMQAYLNVPSYISLPEYANGTERMPFQGRMLMMWPMHWAMNSARLQHWTSGRNGMKTPETLITALAGLLSITITGVLVTLLFRKISSTRQLPYLPYSLVLVACIFNYCLLPYGFPYDMPSMAFFTCGVYLIYTRRFWPLLLLFPFATLNRETTLFLLPLLILDAIADRNGLSWSKLWNVPLLAKLVSLSTIWLVLQLYVKHRFANNPTEMGLRISENIHSLMHPGEWPRILSCCGFLIPFVLLLHRRIEDARFRAYLWIIPMWIVLMFLYGFLTEVRVYGELTAIVAIAATLILEASLTEPAEPALQHKI